MGLDTIVFYGTAAAAMNALAPTTAVIKGNEGDAFIVGYESLAGTDNVTITLTCPGDPRWEPAGVRLNPGSADAAQAGCPYATKWLETKIPIKAGATLVATQDGADDNYLAVHVEYTQYGDGFRPRVAGEQPVAHQVTKTFTAAGAVTAFTISVNADNDNSFIRGREYTPVSIANSGAMTTPFFVGIQNTKTTLTTYWLVPLTPIVSGTMNHKSLPYGLSTVSGGETQFVNMLSTTADTPVAYINYAYHA